MTPLPNQENCSMEFIANDGAPRLSDVTEKLRSLRAKEQHLRGIARAWLGRAAWPAEDDLRFPEPVRAALPDLRRYLDSLVVPARRSGGGDGRSEKLLMKLRDGETVETVVLPKDGVCVSTQVGCAVGCAFCMTGRSGLIRQLGSAEIAARVPAARRINPGIRKVDFMGMGEPSHNLRAVLEAVQFLGTYGDFGHKSLVISTVGDPRIFDALLSLKPTDVRPGLAVSLHSAIDEKRRHLIAKPGALSVTEIISRAQAYSDAVKYPVQYEWVLIRGVNDGKDEIEKLASLLEGKNAMLNFIPVNRVEGSDFVRPEKGRCLELAEILRSRGGVAKIRVSAAQDVEGGCGQLRARTLKNFQP